MATLSTALFKRGSPAAGGGGTEMTAFQDFVTEQVLGGQSIIGLYPATHPETLTRFADWREKHGR